ncbi:MAG: ribosome hibernation-promoting factor, HPF/YfiA family [Dongiaceae bacterium]
MQLTVKGKHLDVGEAFRSHAADSLANLLGKYFGDAIEANVMLSREAHLYHAQISAHIGRGIDMHSHANADTPYAAFDLAADHLAKRLRRYKRRLRDHHRSDVPVETGAQYILAGEEGEPSVETSNGAPAVVAEMATNIPTLSVSEAVMRFDLQNSPAMMFRNRAHGELNMIYRRADGTIGWVDPRGNPPA